MNNQMFYYPLYPQYDDQFMLDEERGNDILFSPKETLMYGNIFKNQYCPYKNYRPRNVDLKNNDLEQLMALMDQCHDLRLHLDVYPNDKEIYQRFVTYCAKLKQIKEKVANSDDNPFQMTCNSGEKTNYVYTPSPWIR